MSYQRDDGHAVAAAGVSPQIRMLQLEALLQEQRAENADLRASVSATKRPIIQRSHFVLFPHTSPFLRFRDDGEKQSRTSAALLVSTLIYRPRSRRRVSYMQKTEAGFSYSILHVLSQQDYEEPRFPT